MNTLLDEILDYDSLNGELYPFEFELQASDMWNMRANAVQIAKQERDRWGNGAKTERYSSMTATLRDYWKMGVGWNPSVSQIRSSTWQSRHPWSAAFISWVMKKAGAGDMFRYAAAHIRYIKQAKENRTQSRWENPFWLYKPVEYALVRGDLVCYWRGTKRLTYDSIDSLNYAKTHCDIVTEIRSGEAITIGGNNRNSVREKKVPLDSLGYIDLSSSKNRKVFAVISYP